MRRSFLGPMVIFAGFLSLAVQRSLQGEAIGAILQALDDNPAISALGYDYLVGVSSLVAWWAVE